MHNELVLSGAADEWALIQEKVQSSIVHVIAQVVSFNWCEPYAVSEHHESRGSGFFIADEGYILTNAHVVLDAQSVWIQMVALGKKMMRASVISMCPERDIALLKLHEDDLAYLHAVSIYPQGLVLGDSDGVQPADEVLLLGYPLAYDRLKVTTGIVSGRELVGNAFLLQITAPVNRGNSGGPLLSKEGHVIGMAVARDALAQNVGYALASNTIRVVLEELFTTPLVFVPHLGMRFCYASDELARSRGNPLPAGMYITGVFENYLAHQLGISAGDMLYEVNGLQVDAYGEISVPWSREKVPLTELITHLKKGQEIRLVLFRNGERREITTFLELVPLLPIRMRFPQFEKIEYEVIGGMVIMNLALNHIPLLVEQAPHLSQFEYLENSTKPVVIMSQVLTSSLAAYARTLSPGDRILTVNGVSITTLDDVREALGKSAQTGFLEIVTEDEVCTVFDIHQVLKDEARLQKIYKYAASPRVAQLEAELNK